MKGHCTQCKHKKQKIGFEPCVTCQWRQEKFRLKDNFELAEPEVLTPDQIIEKVRKTSRTFHWLTDIEKAISLSAENYRLERDKELRPFIKSAEKLVAHYTSTPSRTDYKDRNDLCKKFYEIPPLNK